MISVDRKIQYRINCHINVQKTVRMYLAKKQHRPRYLGIAKINNLQVKYKCKTNIRYFHLSREEYKYFLQQIAFSVYNHENGDNNKSI